MIWYKTVITKKINKEMSLNCNFVLFSLRTGEPFKIQETSFQNKWPRILD